jgi:hypothetical protein
MKNINNTNPPSLSTPSIEVPHPPQKTLHILVMFLDSRILPLLNLHQDNNTSLSSPWYTASVTDRRHSCLNRV